MRLVALAMVKNECDIIEQFVRHNLSFVDALFIIDNQSVDGTREILRDLMHEGLPLVIFDDPRFTRLQSEQMTKLFRTVSEYATPDFTLLLDADELLRAPSRDALEEELAALPSGTHGLIAWKTYLYASESADDDPIRRMRLRRREELPPYYKVVIAADAHNGRNIVVMSGNHGVGHIEHGDLPHQVLPNLTIAHYPVRSQLQITAKAICGWLAILAMDPESAATGYGYQKRDLYQRLMQYPNLSPDELGAISLQYAQLGAPRTSIDVDTAVAEALPVSYTLRYTDHAVPRPLTTLARTMEYVFRPPLRVPFASRTPHAAPVEPIFSAWGASSQYEHISIDLPPFKYIADKYQPRSVMHVGCGLGEYIRMFQEWGAIDVVGIDDFPASDGFLCPGGYLSHDLTSQFELGKCFDLAICTEVMDHIDGSFEDTVLDSINTHARELIIFSAAEPDQPGIGHMIPKPITYWLARWHELGWAVDVFDTIAVRMLSTIAGFRRNLVVLKRGEQAHPNVPTFQIDDLVRIASKHWHWYPQDMRIYSYPLSEPLPGLSGDET